MTKHICMVGASSAIGEELGYHYLRKEDWKVTAVSRSPTDVLRAAAVTPEVALRLMEEVDLANDESALRLRNVKAIDVLVTLPGKTDNDKLVNMDDYQWRSVIDATLTSVANALRYCLPNMNDGGAVVMVGSIVGSTGGYGCSNYAAAKAGLEGLVKAVANEHPKLRVNLLELGYVDAGMGARLPSEVKDKILKTIPMKRFATLTEVIHAVDFLTSQTYCTGNTLTVAGGLR